MRLLQKSSNYNRKMINFFNKILLTTSLVITLTSCHSKIEQNNMFFLEKYGSKVDKINQSRSGMVRRQQRQNQQRQSSTLDWKTPAKSLKIEGYIGSKTAFIDTSKIKPKETPQEFFPSIETLQKGKLMQSKIPQIFNVSYSMENQPKSYKKPQASFDDIKIPSHDYFGIKSSLQAKKYTNISNKFIQNNIDEIHQYFDQGNREINLTLLKEKQQIRQENTAKFLGLTKEEPEEEKDKKDSKEAQQENQNNKQQDSKILSVNNDSKDLPLELPQPL